MQEERLQSKAKAAADPVVQGSMRGRFVKNSKAQVLRVRKFRRLGEKAVTRHKKKVFGRSGSRILWQQGGRVGGQIRRNMWRCHATGQEHRAGDPGSIWPGVRRVEGTRLSAGGL